MRKLLLILLAAHSLFAATAINVSTNVVTPGVKRFGISGISHYYYDRIILKNLVWFNAGFEGLRWRTMIRCDHGTTTSCVDDLLSDQWPTGFWDGGTFEFVLGAAKGRTGTIASFITAPRDNVTGNTFNFADSGTAPAQGDYFIAEKYFPGGAETGWADGLVALNGATVSTESNDLAPDTPGRQCIRLSASGPNQMLQIATPFGSFQGSNFVLLNGSYRITFKAKGVGGTNIVRVRLQRGTNTPMVDQMIPLTTSWATYTVDLTASEPLNTQVAMVLLSFTAGGSSALIDDVSLEQTNGDPTNTTAFRDAVVNVLRDFHPGSLRVHILDQGDDLDDLIGPPFAHRRNEYTPYAYDKRTVNYGWHEFLELCEAVGAEPYLSTPLPFTDREAANLIEYLAGPTTTPYGAKRAARGHPAPWTSVFSKIHLELGNESWNPTFRGVTMFPVDYGHRANDFFTVVRNSPYFDPAKFNLILGVQAANPFNTRVTHNACATHDTLAIGPYIATRIDDYASNEQLFGGLFAEAWWWSSAVGTPNTGPVKQTYDFINGTARPVPLMVYEVNMHTVQGSIPQNVIDSFVPSIGAGLAVADHMLTMLREEKIRDQLFFSLAGYRYIINDGTGRTSPIWAITRDIGITDRKRPQYLATKLINEVIGGDLVETTQTGDNPKWSQPLTNRIQQDNVPYVQSFAFANGTKRGLVIFNLHRTASLDVTVGGPNAPSGTVTVKRLGAANITDSNENSELVTVTTSTLTGFDSSQTLTLPPYSMTVLSSDTGTPQASRTRGDVNGNGSVTAFDASLVLQDVVGATTLDARSQCAADYNGNGSVTAFDASLILQCVTGGACSSASCN